MHALDAKPLQLSHRVYHVFARASAKADLPPCFRRFVQLIWASERCAAKRFSERAFDNNQPISTMHRVRCTIRIVEHGDSW